MAKLTKRTIDALQPGTTDTLHWDDELPGFGVRITPKGVRAYIVQYRNPGGRTRRMTLGKHGVLAPQQAREMAHKLLAGTRGGSDPAEAREREREAPTVKEFAEEWMKRHARPRKQKSSLRSDELSLRLHIVPAIGHRKVRDVTRADVERLRDSLATKKTTANRVLALLSAIFNKAEAWGERPDGTNPTRHVERFKENRRQRPLSPDEIGVLWRYLDRCDRVGIEPRSVTLAIRLLLVTGCRLGEILTLQWEYIDPYRFVAELPTSKTGAKTVRLGETTLELLKAAPFVSEWVIPGPKPQRALVNLEKPWRRIREAAGLADVRLHDLRHSFATRAIAAGLSLAKVGDLLGHKSVATTARYAHFLDDERTRDKAAVDVAMASAISGVPALRAV